MSPILRYWHGRLENWALWVVGADSLGGGSACDDWHGDGAPRPPLPLIGEAFDTNMLVMQLTLPHLEAVRATFVWSGPVLERARALRIHPDTLRDRTEAAMWRLDELDQKRKLARTRVAA